MANGSWAIYLLTSATMEQPPAQKKKKKKPEKPRKEMRNAVQAIKSLAKLTLRRPASSSLITLRGYRNCGAEVRA